jgi:2-phosphosulfolactate phosphatase
LLSLSEAPKGDPKSGVVVALDILRASTTIVTAFRNGCAEIVPVASVDDAREISRLRQGVLLGGERKGRRIDGFDLGNSPLEYTAESVCGRSIVLTTTNGTALLHRFSEFERVVGCFANLHSVAGYLLDSYRDRGVVLVCAGRLGDPGIEDVACAGAIVSLVQNACSEAECDDAALTAVAVWKYFGEDAFAAVSAGSHARCLYSIGFGRDVEYCSRIGQGPVPHMAAGAVSIYAGEGGVR